MPEIVNPPKSWWPGDKRVEEFMKPVDDVIKKYHDWTSPEFTDIYNRAYEAVYNAIIKYGNTPELKAKTPETIKPVCPECGHDVNYSRETYPYEDTESIPDDPKWRVCANCHQEWFTDIDYSTKDGE